MVLFPKEKTQLGKMCIRDMVTGGVNLKNAHEWFEAGVDAIGIGGELNQLARCV